MVGRLHIWKDKYEQKNKDYERKRETIKIRVDLKLTGIKGDFSKEMIFELVLSKMF